MKKAWIVINVKRRGILALEDGMVYQDLQQAEKALNLFVVNDNQGIFLLQEVFVQEKPKYQVPVDLIKEMRKHTGAPLMVCKDALELTKGNKKEAARLADLPRWKWPQE